MRTKLSRRLLVPLVVYIVLWVAHRAGTADQWPSWVVELLSGLITIGFWIVVAAAVSFCLDEVVCDTILPTFRNGFENIADVVGGGISAIKTIIGDRFTEIGASAAAGKIITEEAPKVGDTEISKLIAAGEITAAIAKLREEIKRDPETFQTKQFLVNTLLLSHLREQWDEAWHILQAERNMLREHLTLALRYWSVGRIDKAIGVSEAGLKRAQEEPEVKDREKVISKLKNSLAYYYAETGRPEYEETARKYVDEALNIRPDEVACLDTKAYVKIVYGKDRNEIEEGITLAEEARRRGLEDEFYFKHVEKARQRLASL